MAIAINANATPKRKPQERFEATCWLSDGREATFSGNSYGLGQFIAKLYNKAEQMPEWNQGMIPVVQVTATTPVVIGKGTSYDVGFNIGKWINKPAANEAPAAPAPAPTPAPAPAAAPAGDDNFGF